MPLVSLFREGVNRYGALLFAFPAAIELEDLWGSSRYAGLSPPPRQGRDGVGKNVRADVESYLEE